MCLISRRRKEFHIGRIFLKKTYLASFGLALILFSSCNNGVDRLLGIKEKDDPVESGVVAPPADIPQQGDVQLKLTYNLTLPGYPLDWGVQALYVGARREFGDYENLISFKEHVPATPFSFPREAGQKFDFTLKDVKVGETIIVQGLMCAGNSHQQDCSPDDYDSRACATEVHILKNLKPSCQPVFTWTDICHATCEEEPPCK